MLEVALTPNIAPSVAELLQEDTWQSGGLTGTRISEERWGGAGLKEDSISSARFASAGVDRAGSRVKCAVFYSISSTQPGLVRCYVHRCMWGYTIALTEGTGLFYFRAGLT